MSQPGHRVSQLSQTPRNTCRQGLEGGSHTSGLEPSCLPTLLSESALSPPNSCKSDPNRHCHCDQALPECLPSCSPGLGRLPASQDVQMLAAFICGGGQLPHGSAPPTQFATKGSASSIWREGWLGIRGNGLSVGSAFFKLVTTGLGLGFLVGRRKVSRFHSKTSRHHLACVTLLDLSISLSC